MNAVAGLLIACTLACGPNLPPPTAPSAEPSTAPPAALSETPAPTMGAPSAAPMALKAAPDAGPRVVTVEQLESYFVWRVQDKFLDKHVGSRIDFVGEILPSREGVHVRLSKSVTAILANVPAGHSHRIGDKVRVRALLVDVATQNLTLWTYQLGEEDRAAPAATTSLNAETSRAVPAPPREPVPPSQP